ncbi:MULTISPECIES: hypothetical protein [unclassified Microcoleus]|uniref:hypothetical protein n=1 Tax=unclassified Microcoleus TaxID=2642155 RepID=UPI002FD0C286
MTDKLKQFLELSESEIENIRNTTIKDRCHPVKRLLDPRDGGKRDLQVITNTERALRHLKQHHTQWLMNLKPRLLNIYDYSTSSGALGEIRAFGYILEAGISVKPISGNGADFWVEDNQEKVLIEVHSKQLHDKESESLEKFYNDLRNEMTNRDRNTGGVIGEHKTVPFGKPQEHENVTENAISKLCAIKQREHQMSTKYTSILWLDFQDEVWDLLDTVDRVLPVRTWNKAFYSGELWYAFYGWKDAPIFQYFSLDMPLNDEKKMRHPGRFRNSTKPTKLDAVIISFSRNTVILENPFSKKAIKPSLWKKLTFLPWFNFEYSYTNWPAMNLIQRIELEEEKLKKLIELSSIDL